MDYPGDLPFITVMIPVRNEGRFIGRTLAALAEQDYPADRCEFLVVDGDSDDDTVAVALHMADPRVRVLANPKRLSSAARNVAVRHGRGDLFLLIDGHCAIPTRAYLRAAARAYQGGAKCLGRPQPLDPAGLGPFQRAVAAARHSRLGHNPDSLIYATEPQLTKPQNVAVAYAREVFERVGEFDETFDACEDVEFNTRVDRAGYVCHFEPALRLPYYPRATLGGVFRQLARYGKGRAKLMGKHPGSVTPAALAPAAFVLTLALALLVAALHPPAAWLFGGLAGVYALALCLGSALLWRHGWSVAWRLPAVFAAIHFGFAWGMLGEFGRVALRRLRFRV